MREWLRARPFVVLLIPLVTFILCCEYWKAPINLLQDTEVAWRDTTYTFQAKVIDYPVEREKTYRVMADICAYKDSVWILSSGHVYLYIEKDSNVITLSPGDLLLLYGKAKLPDSIGSFDYGTYLRRQGIAATIYVRHSAWRSIGKSNQISLQIAAMQLQHRLIARYRELGITGAELGTLSALTLGYKEELEQSINQSFQRAGAAHILAVSGLHTGIIFTVVMMFITVFGWCSPLYENKWHRLCNAIIVIAIMWGYALLTGLTPSVVRSVIMITLVEMAYACYRNPISLQTVAGAAFLILLVRPNDLFSVSFQLSFAAVTAILLICPKPIHIPIPYHALSKISNAVVNLAMVSIAAQLGTIPFTLYYFGQVSNYFLLTNLFVIPLATVITISAFALLTIGWLPGIGWLFAIPLKWVIELLNLTTAWIEQLPGAVTII